jgi:hypothetical protein
VMTTDEATAARRKREQRAMVQKLVDKARTDSTLYGIILNEVGRMVAQYHRDQTRRRRSMA